MLLGRSGSPFVLMITAVIGLVIGIALVSTVVTETDTIVTAGSATSNFPLVGTIAVFIPVLYIAGLMGAAGLVGAISLRQTAGDRFANIIMIVILVVIGIALGNTVMTESNTALTAINAAVNTMSLAATIIVFLPVIYIVGLLALASLAGVQAFRGA